MVMGHSEFEPGSPPIPPSYSSQVERKPLYFGPEDAALFGWLHSPHGQSSGKFGMVLCPPLGIDYVNTYPVLRHLADRLASQGIPVLRFDYSGTGNSSGFDVNPCRVSAWLSDIREARETLTRVAGCTEVGLLGVRIGATFATAVAESMALPCLVLWGPVKRGHGYVREMRAMYLTAERSQAEVPAESADIEAGGFVFTAQTAQDLAALNIDLLHPQATRILVVARDDLGRDQAAPDAWTRDGVQTEQCVLPGFAGMLVSPHNSQYKIPHAALDYLEQWIAGVGALLPGERVAADAASRLSATFRDKPSAMRATVRESAFQFGQHNARFGIVTEPLTGCAPDAPWAILANSGALHTVGPNRLYVLLSRALAEAGLCCVRFDFPGVGDSVVAPPALENQSYQLSNSTEIATLIAALQSKYGARRFVLMGLCSGAYASFHAGRELVQEPVVECLLLNPLTFYWEEGMSTDDPPPITSVTQARIEHLNLWQYYIGQMRNPRSWVNLLTARSDTGQVIRAMWQRARLALNEYKHAWFGGSARHRHAEEDALIQDVRAIVESKRRLTFVFSRSDPGYGLLMTHAGIVVRRYMRKKRVRIWFIERANHTFTSQASRAELIRTVVEYLTKNYATSGK